MPVTQHPLHRSVRAELPHTAPALGRDDQTCHALRATHLARVAARHRGLPGFQSSQAVSHGNEGAARALDAGRCTQSLRASSSSRVLPAFLVELGAPTSVAPTMAPVLTEKPMACSARPASAHSFSSKPRMPAKRRRFQVARRRQDRIHGLAN